MTVQEKISVLPPQPGEFSKYHETYISLIKGDVTKELEKQILQMQSIISNIPVEKENYRYAEGKWTIKEVLGHIIDTERIMAYRMLGIARNDKTRFPGFDENTYVANANFSDRSLYDLAHEFGIVRDSNLILIKSFNEDTLKRKGISNEVEVSVRALVYIIAGHVTHHLKVIKERYLGLSV